MTVLTQDNFPALNGGVVTERHTRLCRVNGHLTHRVDGILQERCPRCGELRENVGEDDEGQVFVNGVKVGRINQVAKIAYGEIWYRGLVLQNGQEVSCSPVWRDRAEALRFVVQDSRRFDW